MFFKPPSLNLAALEDAQLAPRAGHQTAVCMWNPSSTKLSFFRQGKTPSHGPRSAPGLRGAGPPPRRGEVKRKMPLHKRTARVSGAACLTLAAAGEGAESYADLHPVLALVIFLLL